MTYVLSIYRYKCLRNPFCGIFISAKCYSNHIKHTFMVAIWFAFPTFEKTLCRSHNSLLLPPVHTFLRRGLYALAPGLYLYKMYSNSIKCYDVNFEMSAAPIPFQNHMPHILKHHACDILSQATYSASVIASTLHAPSSFLNVAFFVLLRPSVSSV